MRFSCIISPLIAAVSMAQAIEPSIVMRFPSGQDGNKPWPNLPEVLNKTIEIDQSMVALTADFKERVRELALAKCEPPFIDPKYEAAQKPTCYKDAYDEIHLKITGDSKVNPLNVTVSAKMPLHRHGKMLRS